MPVRARRREGNTTSRSNPWGIPPGSPIDVAESGSPSRAPAHLKSFIPTQNVARPRYPVCVAALSASRFTNRSSRPSVSASNRTTPP